MNLPVLDLSIETDRQVVIAHGTQGTFQGHPTTMLMPGGRMIFQID